MGRERPSQAMVRQCTSACPAVPIREAKRGGRSRPPPNSPSGTAKPRVEPKLQREQQVREMCLCTSKGLSCAHALLCPMCAPRSIRSATFQRSKSASGKRVARDTERPLSPCSRPPLFPTDTSLQQVCRLPSGVAVDNDLDGTVFCQRLQLDAPLPVPFPPFPSPTVHRYRSIVPCGYASCHIVYRWLKLLAHCLERFPTPRAGHPRSRSAALSVDGGQ